jgi:DNA-binding CsgD family transcriptional regulator
MIYSRMAFVVFQPGPPGTAARVNMSPGAETVLAFTKDPSGKTLPSLESAIAMCSKWASLLGKVGGGRLDSGKEPAEFPPPIEVLVSHRRKYEVHGIVLNGRLQGSVTRYPGYLFILERSDPSKVVLQKIFREKRLSPREQDLAQLLFSNMSNKEIGQIMGLSPNTIKGYLKTLALKLGVSTRIGILAALYMPKGTKTGKTGDAD